MFYFAPLNQLVGDLYTIGMVIIVKVSVRKTRSQSMTGLIGVYSKIDGIEKLIYLKKHKITTPQNTISIAVNAIPSRAGIDPLHKLIGRHSDDNTRVVRKAVVKSSGIRWQ